MKWLESAMVLVGCATLVGCEPYYSYLPATPATVEMGGSLAAEYAVPREAPRGHVWVDSYGIVDVSPQASDDDVGALHVRAVIANDSDQDWTLDTRQQEVDIEGAGSVHSAFASSDPGSTPPVITIAKGTRRTVDLFFPLPEGVDDEDQIPHFDALWRIGTPGQDIAERTPFERVDSEYGASPEYDAGPYWGGPYYWYNPLYPRFAIVVGPHYAYGRHFVIRGGHYGHYGWHGGGFRGHGGFRGGGGFHGGFHGGHGGGHGGHR